MVRISFAQTIMAIVITLSTSYAMAADWSYIGNTGPARWGQLNPNFSLCAEGKNQSPINIPKHTQKATYDLSFAYQAAPLVEVVDGETDLTMKNQTITIHDGHGVQVNFAKITPEILMFKQSSYQLVQFHFHSPSENLLHGVAAPLEIHFVHQNANGELVVVGVFVMAGKPNATFDQIIAHLPKEHGKEQIVNGVNINPKDLLPKKLDYYSFQGSLTTPPCLEGVQWLVMANPITASPSQIMAIRQVANGANARPVQALHQRSIMFST